ncbi:MAG: fimbrillin family protein [Rikenellaceae bacterium]|nr:fimbrillin family protein [Rikenellaceae bacterium]
MRIVRYDHFTKFNSNKACRALIMCAALAAVTGCYHDDTFDESQNPGGPLRICVSTPQAWSPDTPSHPAGGPKARLDDVDIRRIESPDGSPLYLIAEISEAGPAEPAGPDSRGTLIESGDDFYGSFGMTAILRGGDETSAFAENLEMAKAGTGDWKPTSETKWPSAADLHFYAYAPYCYDGSSDNSQGSIAYVAEKHALEVVVATDVKQQRDIMTAHALHYAGISPNVSLSFGHAMTAVTFKTGDAMSAGTVNSVQVSGVYGAGTLDLISGQWTLDPDRILSEGFTSESDVVLERDPGSADDSHITAPDQPIDNDGEYIFIMVPQTLPKDAKLTVTFTDAVSKTERTLTASLGGQTWRSGTRVAYSLSSKGIVVEPHMEVGFAAVQPTSSTEAGRTQIDSAAIIPISGFIPDFRIKAYADVYQFNESSNKVELKRVGMTDLAVSWATTPDAASWTDANWTKRTDPVYGNDDESDDYAVGSILIEPRAVFETMRSGLYDQPVQGAAGSPQSLAKGGETANCYMVHAPGYYSFPLVYGNATDGPAAYTYLGSELGTPDYNDYKINEPRNFVLKNFVDYNDKAITTPYITDAADAVLVWQDSPSLITDIKLDNGSVTFKIDKESINQGNAVIAVRDAAGNILWSWHIWVTHHTWGDGDLISLPNNFPGSTNDYELTPTNLGYCDPHEADQQARKYYVRVTASLPDGSTQTHTSENAYDQAGIEGSEAGDNTYYQWGRKDPMLPGIWNENTLADAYLTTDYGTYNMANKPYYPGVYRFMKADCFDGKTIGESIRYPYQFFQHDPAVATTASTKSPARYWRGHWHGGDKAGASGIKTIMNYWDSQLATIVTATGRASQGSDQFPTKTVYDPCPPGFCVPPANAFLSFSSNGTKAGANSFTAYADGRFNRDGTSAEHPTGWTIVPVDSVGNTGAPVSFPATGLRDMGVGNKRVPYWFDNMTKPAFADLTFVASSTFQRSNSSASSPTEYYYYASSLLLFYIDDRVTHGNIPEDPDNNDGFMKVDPTSPSTPNDAVSINGGSNNAYGCSIRPVKRTQ